jgi:NAD(P)-dependent dehydrogenase (short-subunit alcohol dehydrogenase family)
MAETVIITGAAGNLGQAMVSKFLQEGYQVAGIVAPADKTDQLPKHDRLYIQTADLTNEANTELVVGEVIKKWGNIDVAVLTVGGFAMGIISETSLEDITHQIKLNFNTAYSVVRPVFKQMRINGKGRIFLVGSGPGLNMHNSRGMTAYGLSKSLLFRLSELLNEESSGTNMITQVIVPSTIDTPQNRKSMPDADFSKWVKAETIANETFRHIRDISKNNLIIF